MTPEEFELVLMRRMDIYLLVEFGQKVRRERLKEHLSQDAFAMKAQFHRTNIGRGERGETNITLTNMVKSPCVKYGSE